jgi:RHS repeat-associated protein
MQYAAGFRSTLRATAPVLKLCAGAVLMALFASSAGAAAIGRIAAESGVDPAGAATWSMPVNVTAGRGGLRPAVSLRYNSHEGEGLAGAGMTLAGLSKISRCAQSIAVDGRMQGVRFVGGDRYCLDGQPLVLLSGSYGADGAEYRTELNNLQRVISRGQQGSGPAWFEVQHPDGLSWRYGNDADSRIEAVGLGSEVREWAVNQVSDRFGNQLLYSYSEDQNTGEAVPDEIRWSADANGAGARFRLVFVYESRPAVQQRTGYTWGARWQRARQLQTIRYEFDAGSGFALVHSWSLAYAVPDGSERSRVTRVRQCGPTECLPDTVLGWQATALGFQTAAVGATDALAGEALFADHDGDGDMDLHVPVVSGGTRVWRVRLAQAAAPNPYVGIALATTIPANGPAYLIEYDGDGRRDLVTAGPTGSPYWFVHRSTGAGFAAGINTGLSTTAVPALLVMDPDGDGLSELGYFRDGALHYLPNTGSGFAAARATSVIQASGSGLAALDAAAVDASADFDGDGRRDLLVTRKSLNAYVPGVVQVHLSTSSDFQAMGPAFESSLSINGECYSLDLNGDGLADLTCRQGWEGFWSWNVRLSRGNAWSAAEMVKISTMANGAIRVADVDGDGRDDLICQLSATTWRVHLANGGIAAPALDNTDPARYMDLSSGITSPANPVQLALVDANADGQTDLLFSEASGRWHARLRSGPQSGLLTSVTDGLGNTWRPEYSPLGRFAGYTHAGSDGTDQYLMRGGSMHVVSRYTANDGIGGEYVVDYAYSNGRLHRLGRGFLGFEKVRATDSRYAAAHGVSVYTETVYRQDFPYIGLPDLITTLRSDGRRISVLDPGWAVNTRAAAASDQAADYHLVLRSRETSEDYETDPDGGTLGQLLRTRTTTRSFDTNHGVPITETVVLSSPASPEVFTTTTATTLDDTLRTGPYCLGLPSRVSITRDNSRTPAETRTTRYVWSAHTCRKETEVTGAPAPLAQRLVTTQLWNEIGQLVEVTRMAADFSLPERKTLYTYEAWGNRPVTETALIGGQVSPVIQRVWHHGLDQQLSETSPRGLVTSWTWDDFGRLKQESRADGPGTTVQYLSCAGGCFAARGAYQQRSTRGDGFWSITVHDAWGRAVGSEFPLTGGQSSRQLTEYDALGRMQRQTVPYINGESQYWVDYRYDLAGRRKSEDRPVDESGSATAGTRWTSSLLTRTVRDAENRVSTQTYDAEGRLVAVNAPAGGTTTYAYLPFGELGTLSDANGTVTTLGYDARGLQTSVESADTGRRTSTWNAFGELVSQSDALTPANTITFSYDQLGRLVQRTDPGQSPTVWTFHTASGPLLGLPLKVTAPIAGAAAGFVEQYAYDASGRRTSVSTTIDGSTWVTGYGWDSLGRVATMSYPQTIDGAQVLLAYHYDSTGNLDVVEQDVGGGGSFWMRVYDLQSMDAVGRRRHAKLGSYSQIDEQHIYDRASTRLREIRTGAAMGAGRQNYSYAWDKTGNLLQRQDLRQGISEEFSYDEQNRLLSARRNAALTLALTYDAAGRIRSKSDAGNYSYSTAHPGAVVSVSGGPAGTQSFGYDANGNMSSRNGMTLSWTAAQLPKRINHAGSDYVEFEYGPDRHRVRQIARTGGNTVTTYYIGPHFEVQQSGSNRRYQSNIFVNGEAILAQVEQSNPLTLDAYFLHRDHQGSVDSLSRFVGSGPQQIAPRFDVFGKRRNADWTADATGARYADPQFTRRGYTGHEHLDNVRLIHMNGRLQDPLLGVMLTPDPLLGILGNSQSLGRYAYVTNNPASLSDPGGFLFGKVGKFFKRAIRGFGSLAQRTVRKYGREIAAAVAAYYTAGAVSEAYMAATPGASLAAGDTLGAMAGGAVAGGVSTGDLRGIAVGTAGGALFGGMDAAWGGSWDAGRVLASGVAGGALAEAGGGEFRQGFLFAGGAAGLSWGYQEVVNYAASWESGSAAQGKYRYTMPRDGVNNIGEAVAAIDPNSIWGEGGRLSRAMNRIPGINAVAGLHDVFQVRLDQFGGSRFGPLLRGGLNFPGMPVAAALTYPALLQGVPAVMMATDED